MDTVHTPGLQTVFESNWDLERALKLLYQDNTIRANIVTADFDINDDRIRISGSGVQNYPFKNLFIYNHKEKSNLDAGFWLLES